VTVRDCAGQINRRRDPTFAQRGFFSVPCATGQADPVLGSNRALKQRQQSL
jgi:hypothetical protein